MGIGTIVAPFPQTWFVDGPFGGPGASVLTSVVLKVPKLDGDVWKKWGATVEWDVAPVKLNKVLNRARDCLVQVGQIFEFLKFLKFCMWGAVGSFGEQLNRLEEHRKKVGGTTENTYALFEGVHRLTIGT